MGWKYKPQGMTAAQLNLPFCIATLLIEGDVFVDQFPEEAISDPRRMALADKVEVVNDPEITALGGKHRFKLRVEVHLKDGTRMERTVATSRGSEQNFASEQKVVDKFEKLSRNVLSTTQMRELRDAVLGLEKLSDAAELARLLQPS